MAGKKNMGMGSAFQNVKTSGKTRPGTLDAFYQKMAKKKGTSGFKKAPKK